MLLSAHAERFRYIYFFLSYIMDYFPPLKNGFCHSQQLVHYWTRSSLPYSTKAIEIWRSWRLGGHGGPNSHYERFWYKYSYPISNFESHIHSLLHQGGPWVTQQCLAFFCFLSQHFTTTAQEELKCIGDGDELRCISCAKWRKNS